MVLNRTQTAFAFTKARHLAFCRRFLVGTSSLQIPKPDDGFDNRHCVSHSERVLLRCPQTRREGTIMNCASAHERLENHISKVWRYRPWWYRSRSVQPRDSWTNWEMWFTACFGETRILGVTSTRFTLTSLRLVLERCTDRLARLVTARNFEF